jgi:homopolymeric O-antigen transport system ATP-binding protein
VPVIEARAVSKRFFLRHNASSDLKVRFLGLLHRTHRQSVEEFWALRDVSLQIDHGEALGLVGRNGSGKSTFLKLLAGIHRPSGGRVLIERGARISSMIELGVGFHPELTGRENIFLSAAIHGLTGAEIKDIFEAVVEYSGLQHFIDVPIKNYSSGMHMRLGFAISANLDPDILLLDEIFAVGDADFQHRCTNTVKSFIDSGKTIVFVSHAAAAVRAICRRVCVLDHGALEFDGGVKEGLAFYDDLIARHGTFLKANSPGGVAVVVDHQATSESELNAMPHRIESGGLWGHVGGWTFDFLRRQGLQPDHHVLDVGCGSLNVAVHLLPFLNEGRYWGLERDPIVVEAGLNIELPRAGVLGDRGHYLINDKFQLEAIPQDLDFALASSVFAYLPFNSVAMCIAGVVRRLTPAGRFYATWFENPDPADFDPIVRPGGGASYPDRTPYHYPFEMIERVCGLVGATVERVAGETHPRGESVLLITRRSRTSLS